MFLAIALHREFLTVQKLKTGRIERTLKSSHNSEYVLFGYFYLKEFSYPNDLDTRYPEQNAYSLQLQIFDITHDAIGM